MSQQRGRIIAEHRVNRRAASVADGVGDTLRSMADHAMEHLPDLLVARRGAVMELDATVQLSGRSTEAFFITLTIKRLPPQETDA